MASAAAHEVVVLDGVAAVIVRQPVVGRRGGVVPTSSLLLRLGIDGRGAAVCWRLPRPRPPRTLPRPLNERRRLDTSLSVSEQGGM